MRGLEETARVSSAPQTTSPKPSAKKRILLTVGAKLVGLIAVLLIASILSLVYLSTRLFIEDNTALIQQMNADKAMGLSVQMRESFESVTEKMQILGTVLAQHEASGSQDSKEGVIQEFFTKDKDFLALYAYHRGQDGRLMPKSRAVSAAAAALDAAPAQGGEIQPIVPVDTQILEQAAKGEVTIQMATLADGNPAMTLSIPVHSKAGEEVTDILTAVLRPAKFVKAFSESDIVTSFMVDSKGRLLAHPDAARVAASENIASLEIVRQMLSGKFHNGQTRYLDPATREMKLGAYRLVGFAGLGVVTEVPEGKAFEAARRVEYRAMLIAGIILCISFFLGYLYSKSITWPLKLLMNASRQISEGDFKINLKPKGNDEVAHLSHAFNEMAKGLEERDRVKATFAKFHSKEVAEKVLSGQLNLGGERKSATVFFSDVRGFTAMGERMDPESLVKVLNRYMTRMVRVILAHGGIVDKYVGDAIMALWGVPLSKEGDTERALMACLGMRKALAELNEEFIAEGLPVLKIGMGLNHGALVSGNIGSEERMEYTVIGDTVNTASRIESLTKEFGTDLLISQEVLDQLGDKFIVEKAHEAKVKGKKEPLIIYKVHGYYDETRAPILVRTPYSSYQAEKSDKVVHDDKHKAPEEHPQPVAETAASVLQPPPFVPPPVPAVMPPPFRGNVTPPPFRFKKTGTG